MTQHLYYYALVGIHTNRNSPDSHTAYDSCKQTYYFKQPDLSIIIYGEDKEATIKRGKALIKLKVWDNIAHHPETLPIPSLPQAEGAELCRQLIKLEDETYAKACCLCTIEAAKILGISKQHVYYLVHTHVLDSIKLNKRQLYITKASIHARLKALAAEKELRDPYNETAAMPESP